MTLPLVAALDIKDISCGKIYNWKVGLHSSVNVTECLYIVAWSTGISSYFQLSNKNLKKNNAEHEANGAFSTP